MLKSVTRALAIVAVAALPLAAFTINTAAAHAHGKDEHEHEHDKMKQHGGEMTEVGQYDVEVVVSGGKLMLYLYNAKGQDVTKDATKGDAIFVVGGASKKVTLAPADGALAGTLGFPTKPTDHLDTVLRLVVSGKTVVGKTDIHPH